MQHDIHNPWRIEDRLGTFTEVSLHVSLAQTSICIDNRTVFCHHGQMQPSDLNLVKFIAQGLANHFNTELIVEEKEPILN